MDSIIRKVTNYWETYEYSKAKQEVEIFFWRDFTDNYLEIVKREYIKVMKEKEVCSIYIVCYIIKNTKITISYNPFITEEIYQLNYRKHEKIKSIHISEWPKELKTNTDDLKS